MQIEFCSYIQFYVKLRQLKWKQLNTVLQFIFNPLQLYLNSI